MTDRFNAFGEYRADGFRLGGAATHSLQGATPLPQPEPEPSPLRTQVGGSHYRDMKIQPVEFVHANGIGYFEGNVIKYVARWRAKNGVADLEKARHYLDLLIELERRSAANVPVSK